MGSIIVSELIPVACLTWTNSKGVISPLSLKFKDHDEELHTIRDIQVLQRDQNYKAGFKTTVYRCSSVIEGQKYCFDLIQDLETQKWKMRFGT